MNGLFLDPINICLSDCPNVFFKNVTNNKCEPCNNKCKHCTGTAFNSKLIKYFINMYQKF